MSQESVMDFLKENPKRWFGSKYIAIKIGIQHNTATQNLKRLRKGESILYRISKEFKYEYRHLKDDPQYD